MQPSHSELYETGDPSYFLSLRMSQALHTAREWMASVWTVLCELEDLSKAAVGSTKEGMRGIWKEWAEQGDFPPLCL